MIPNATPLGPPASWPVALITNVHLLLTSNLPMFIWWGPDLIQFYNDGFRRTMGLELDGNTLVRHLLAQPATRHMVCIAVTGYGRDQDRDAALAAGFRHHMVKPVDVAQLTSLLARLHPS